MPASVSSALDWEQSQHDAPSQSWLDKCLQAVRTAWGVGAKYGTASEAWSHTQYRHTDGSTPPAGAPVWWSGGQGHVALSAGGGYVWSNDIVEKGRIDKVPLDQITKQWGKPYLGWTEDVNDVRVIDSTTASTAAGGGLAVTPVGFSAGSAGDLVGALISPGGAAATAVGGAAADKTAKAVAPLVYRGAALLLAGGLVVAGLYRAFAPPGSATKLAMAAL